MLETAIMRVTTALIVLAVAAAASGGSSNSFSLPVDEKPGYTRNYVRAWAAAHQKWGKGIPSSVISTFSLMDDGLLPFELHSLSTPVLTK
jgi:uncharacterized protein YceK